MIAKTFFYNKRVRLNNKLLFNQDDTWMKFNRCIRRMHRRSRERARVNPESPLLFSLLSPFLSRLRAHTCASCACDACERGSSHAAARAAPCVSPLPLPSPACTPTARRRPRATPEPYEKLIIVITYEHVSPRADRGRIALLPPVRHLPDLKSRGHSDYLIVWCIRGGRATRGIYPPWILIFTI